MTPARRIALLCALVWLGLLAMTAVLRDAPPIRFEDLETGAAVAWPARLAPGDVVAMRIDARGARRLLAVDIAGIDNPDFVFRLGEQQVFGHCTPEPRACRLLVPASQQAVVYLVAQADVVVEAVTTTVIRHQWQTAADGGLPLLLAGVVLMIPLSVLLHPRPLLQRRALLGATLLLLLGLQPLFTLLVVAALALLHRIGTRGRPGTPARLAAALATAAAILLTLKYALAGLDRVFANPGGFALLAPLGLSYIVIRLVDTQIRWHRNQLRDVPLDEFLFFVLFPATLAAGPVDTLERFRGARAPVRDAQAWLSGLRRIGWGLFKKLAIADALLLPLLWGDTGHASAAFAPGGDPVAAVALLFCAFAYVYVDFSAYTDLAVGFSRLLGWTAPENFNLPFLATSVTDFWRRWHISVSGWCMRNIYMPLLIATRLPVLAAMMVMLAVGMWHSIGLAWMMWAVHHGALLAIESVVVRARGRSRGRTVADGPGTRGLLRSVPGRVATLTWVAGGHAFAQVESPGAAIDLYLQFWRGLVQLVVAPWRLLGGGLP